MKIFRAEIEEIIGTLLGAFVWFLLVFIADAKIPLFTVSGQIRIWLVMGLFILFMIVGHYIVSKNVINEKKRIDDIAGIKSHLIGYFLWLILMIFAYLLNIKISSYASLIGGYTVILLIFLYMKRKMVI
jgi:uncharacterized membrane protein (GlpM family)